MLHEAAGWQLVDDTLSDLGNLNDAEAVPRPTAAAVVFPRVKLLFVFWKAKKGRFLISG